MSMTDPIADLLTRIRNAHLAKHDRLDVPASKLKAEVCKILEAEGFIKGYEQAQSEDEPRGSLRILLRYGQNGQPAIRHMQRVSVPGRRAYRKADQIRPVLNGLGVSILSTSKGLLTDRQAREARIGGELLCEIW